jgi:hypothetical protein
MRATFPVRLKSAFTLTMVVSSGVILFVDAGNIRKAKAEKKRGE